MNICWVSTCLAYPVISLEKLNYYVISKVCFGSMLVIEIVDEKADV